MLAEIAGGTTLGVPNSVYFALVALLIVSFMLKKTVIGRRFEAIGANPAAARAVGLHVRLHQMMAYVCSQLLCCLAGVLLAGITREPTAFQGDALLLPSVAVVVLGGTSLLGGRGFPVSTVDRGVLSQSTEPVRARHRRSLLGANHHPGPGARVWYRGLLCPMDEKHKKTCHKIMLEEKMKASFKYALSPRRFGRLPAPASTALALRRHALMVRPQEGDDCACSTASAAIAGVR